MKEARVSASAREESLEELARRFVAGDEEAFDGIARSVAPRIYALAARSTGNRDAAEEIVQETLVRVYERMKGLKEPGAFEGWLYRVALNKVYDHFRARARTRAAMAGLSELREYTRSSRQLAPHEREELSKALRDAIASLDDKHRDVFVMREIEEKPHDEIARILEIPLGTVWSRLSYARKMLRERLSKEM